MTEWDSTPRGQLYARLSKTIGHTPFSGVLHLDLPNGCKLYAKEEYRNPSGSHYDREMIQLFWGLEARREIFPAGHPKESKLVETTTGNSGASFAWLARALEFRPPRIFIPEDMPDARIAQIRSYGAEVVFSPAGDYITGLSSAFKHWYAPKSVRSEWVCPAHWQDEVFSVGAMRDLGAELLLDFEKERLNVSYFVLALGNGASARGVGEILRERGIKLVGMEPAESPVVAESLGTHAHVPHTVHGIIGTGPLRDAEIFPNMRVARTYLTEVHHPTTEQCKDLQEELADKAGQHVGVSSGGCVWVCREIAKKAPFGTTFATIFYDPSWKYLSLR